MRLTWRLFEHSGSSFSAPSPHSSGRWQTSSTGLAQDLIYEDKQRRQHTGVIINLTPGLKIFAHVIPCLPTPLIDHTHLIHQLSYHYPMLLCESFISVQSCPAPAHPPCRQRRRPPCPSASQTCSTSFSWAVSKGMNTAVVIIWLARLRAHLFSFGSSYGRLCFNKKLSCHTLHINHGGPYSHFDGKTARWQHEHHASLLPRPYWGEHQNKTPIQTTLSLVIKRKTLSTIAFDCISCAFLGGRKDTIISWRARTMIYIYTHITNILRDVGGVKHW